MTTIELIEKFASETPDKTAVIPLNRAPISYLNLRNSVYGYIAQLAKLEISGKTRIGLISKDSCQLVKLFYSISSLCIAVPLDCNLSKNQYDSMFDLLKLDYIVLGDGLDEFIESSARKANIPLVNLCEKPQESIVLPKKSPDDIAFLLTTSGTTSKPKIVPLTHLNILSAVKKRRSAFELECCDCGLLTTVISRGVGFNGVLTSHFAGGSVVLMNGFSLFDFFKIFEKHSPTWISTSPAVLESIASYVLQKNIKLPPSKIRFVRSSGAPLSESLRTNIERIFSTSVIKTYGMTEVGTISSTYGTNISGKELSVGLPLDKNIKILDGEILVKGDNVFSGYLDAPNINKKEFIDGWFRTGDIGEIDKDGFVYIRGRIKEMINKGGEKISPYEVEKHLVEHPLIKQAVVFPEASNQGNEDVAAAIVLEGGDSVDIQALRNFLGNYISSYKIPSIYYVADHIPVGENGKFQRKKMSSHFSEFQPLTDTNAVSAEKLTETEKIVKKYYEKILKKKGIGIHQNFFDSGGDSLSASFLHSELVDAFGTDIPAHAFFDYPEIGRLSKFIDEMERKKDALKFVVPLSKSGFKEPLFFIHSLDGDALGYYNVARRMDPDRPVYGVQFKYDSHWTSPLDFYQIAEKYIEEIKLVRPVGPYYIAGICLGGKIAYEIAQQLSAKHEDVKFLAMFDVIMLSEADAEIVPHNTLLKKTIRTYRQFREIRIENFWKLFVRKSKSLFIYLSTKYAIKINSRKDFLVKNRRAILTRASKGYNPIPYEGPVVYYQGKDHTPKSELSATAWQKLIGNMKIIRTDMEHNDFSNPEKASDMAELLNNELRYTYD